jgi:hypothetical protein
MTMDRKVSMLDGETLSAALAYYRMSHARFARHTRTAETTISRFLKKARGPDDSIPRWVDCILFMYENHPDLLGIEDPSELILPEWGLSDIYPWITGGQVADLLDRMGVEVDVFASDLGRDIRAVRDYLNETKTPIPGWMVWVLVLYTYHPELRGGEELDLPIERWKEFGRLRKPKTDHR